MHPTHNTRSQNIRTQPVEWLNRRLAAAIDLHGQLKPAHWNLRGPSFIGIHELFDEVAGEAETYSDLIAERAAGLGDDETADLFTGMSRGVDHQLWLVESHVAPK